MIHMDKESKLVAESVAGVTYPSGTVRPFAQLTSILVRTSSDCGGGAIEQIYFVFKERTLEVLGDDEFFTVERIHLRNLDEYRSLESGWIELIDLPDFSHLAGMDLAAVRWELLAGDIDQFVVLEFIQHRRSHGAPKAALTIRGDDFQLYLFKGAPLFPKLQFDPSTQVCRPQGGTTND
jgi:hypothetical protein